MHIKEVALISILTVFGCVLVIFGITCTVVWPGIFENIFAKEMELTPNSRSYESWKQPPVELYLDIYMFNWTNHHEFKNLSVKPILQELGPYRFRELPEKVDIKFNPKNSTVTYRRLSIYHFDEENSNGTLDDEIITINMVALSASEHGRFADFTRARSISVGLSLYQQQIQVKRTARELLFEGYEDDMVTLAKQMPFLSGADVPFDRIGYFYTRNNSADLTGWYNMHTGVGDISQIGKLQQWNFKDRNGAFEGECGEIQGSAGEFYPPKLSKSSEISLFTADMCRSIPLDYETEAEIHGIKGYKFSGGERSVDNGTKYPETACYAPGEGAYAGVLNITSCRFGAPIYMSYPHFFAADPYYLQQVEGMRPEAEKHQFYMTLEPYTGIALDVAARLQLNLLIRPNPQVSLFSEVPRVFMPILWFEQKVTMSPELAAEISTALMVPVIGQVCGIVSTLIGLIMLLWYPFNKIIRKRISKEMNQKSSIKIITMEDLEKHNKVPEDSPLLNKNTTIQNIEIKKSQDLNRSIEKIPYIDGNVSSTCVLGEKSASMSLLDNRLSGSRNSDINQSDNISIHKDEKIIDTAL